MFKKIIILLLSLFTISAVPCKDIILQGKIVVKGNEPHTYLALVTDKQEEFAIVGNGKFKKLLSERYQQQIVKVKARIVKKAIGPGFSAEIEVIGIIK